MLGQNLFEARSKFPTLVVHLGEVRQAELNTTSYVGVERRQIRRLADPRLLHEASAAISIGLQASLQPTGPFRLFMVTDNPVLFRTTQTQKRSYSYMVLPQAFHLSCLSPRIAWNPNLDSDDKLAVSCPRPRMAHQLQTATSSPVCKDTALPLVWRTAISFNGDELPQTA